MNNVIQIIWDFLNKPIFKRKEMIKLIIDEVGYLLTINGKEFRSPGFVNIPVTKLNDIVRYLKSQGISKYKFVAEPEKPKQHPRIISKKEIPQLINDTQTSTIIYQTDPNLTQKLERLESLILKISEKNPVIIQQITSSENGKNIIKTKDDDTTFIPSVNTSDLQLKVSGSKTLENETNDLSAVEALSKLKKKG